MEKFKRSCRRGSSRERVQKARRTSTLISPSFPGARTARFLIHLFCLPPGLYYIFITLLRLPEFSMQLRRKLSGRCKPWYNSPSFKDDLFIFNINVKYGYCIAIEKRFRITLGELIYDDDYRLVIVILLTRTKYFIL